MTPAVRDLEGGFVEIASGMGWSDAMHRRMITTVVLADWYRDIVKRGVQQRLSLPRFHIRSLELGIHGRYLNVDETGDKPAILIAYARVREGDGAVWNTLAHETAHHAVYELCRKDSSGHGYVFCNVANEMARRLKLDVPDIDPETDGAKFWPSPVG